MSDGGAPTSDHLRNSAYHEAGHAVAAVTLGRGITGATIEPDDDTMAGCVTYQPRTDAWWDRIEEAKYDCAHGGFIDGRLRRQVEVEIMCALAGQVTSAIYGDDSHEAGAGIATLTSDESEALSARFGQPFGERMIVPDSDWGCIARLVEAVSGSDGEAGAYAEWLLHRTGNMCRHPLFMARVEAVAIALLERRSLRARDIREAIDRGQADAAERLAADMEGRSVFGHHPA